MSLAISSRIFRIKNAKVSGCFYMNANIEEDFQIYISVLLNGKEQSIIFSNAISQMSKVK